MQRFSYNYILYKIIYNALGPLGPSETMRERSGPPGGYTGVARDALVSALKLDEASVCAALLHDVVEDTEVELEEISERFSAEVAHLVDGVTKLDKITFKNKADRQAESFRKMLVAMSQDIRVLLVKLCDRLHNMRTLEHMKADAQARIAEEAGAVAVMSLERVPADIRAHGGVARMADTELGEVCPDASVLQALAVTLEGP